MHNTTRTKSIWILLLFLILVVNTASADVSIVNDTLFNLDNNAYIKVLTPQTSTNITIYNSTSTPASTLQFYINGAPIRFNANANKTLSNISYNNATDVVAYTGNGTTGYLNVSARMNLSLGYYDFEVDGIVNQTQLSGASGWVTFNYTGWIPNQHDFRIKRTGAPGITSWGNNKTNNDSQTLTINISEAVNFNATANQSIDIWSWFKDNANQGNNYDNFTTSFNVVGIHTIKVNATNTNGTSNTITWTVTVQALAVAPSITSWSNNKTNNNTLNLTINASEFINFNATANQSIDIWNWFKDDVNQNNNYDNFTTNFTSGTHTIKVNATNNANGTSDTIVWTVNVQAIRGVILANISALSLPTNAGTNATYILNLTNNGTDADSYNLTVDNPDTAAVGLNISTAYYFLNSGETKIFSLNVTGASAGTFKVNVTALSTNDTSRFNYVNTTTTVTAAAYLPPTPIILTNNTGNFFVNTIWQAGSGNITDSYNVSVNGAWVTNGSTNTYVNSTLSAHAWQNVSVYAFNSSGAGTLNTTPAARNTQILNNVIVISNISDSYSLFSGDTLYIDANYQDADNDPATFARNFTNGTFNTGTGLLVWTTTDSDEGTHFWQINVTDGYGSVSSKDFTVTVTIVPAGAPNITGFAPSSPVSNTAGSSRTFNITVNQTVNVTWYINGTLKKTDTGVTDSSYTNTSAALGIWNVTAEANNANGAVSRQWIWNVTEAPTGVPNITGFAPTSPVSNTAGSSRTFNITVNQTVNVTWYINGTLKKTDTGVTDSSYTNTSAALGIWNVTAAANNANGAVSKLWIWNVTEAPTGVPNITGFAPASPVSNTAGSSRTFNITVNQTVNVTWYINGTLKKTDTGVTDSSYTNTSAALGIWNVTAAANNANGAVSKLWIWNVTAALVINITSPANNSVNDAGYVNVTVTLNMPGTALLNWEGINESMYGAGTDFYKNKTGLLSGNYSFRVYANDSGVSNVSETRIITVNRTTTTDLSTYIDPVTRNVNQTVNLPAPSSNSTLTIFSGTNVTLNGAPITNITIDSLARVNSTYAARLDSSDKLVGENLSFGPDGARFSPDIQIRLNYTDAQLTAAGINASALRVKFYNTTTNTWVEQTPYTLNETGKYIIANVSHFTTFALIGTAAVVPTTPAPTAALQASPVSTAGGGGGGGAGAISPEPVNNIDMFEITEEYLGANIPASYIYTTPNLVISEVLITPAKNFGTTSIRVEMLKDISKIEGVTQPPGIVYKYVNIWAGAKELEREEGIIDAFIGFKVDRSWLAGNNLAEGSIRLLRWDGSKWVSLETAPRSIDEQFVYYIAKTNGFSPFAIVSISLYPSATIAVVETPVLIKTPLQKITESGILLLGYILIAFIIISLVLYKLMRYKKPVKVYEKAMEIKPGDADAWYNRGFDLYEQGKYDEAIKAYDKAIEIIHESGKEKKD